MEDSTYTALMAQTMIDVGVVLHLMATRMDAETRDEELKIAQKKATARLKRKLQSSSFPDLDVSAVRS